jgi:hypothetical protein
MMNLFKNIAVWVSIVALVAGPWVVLSPETFGQRVIAFLISWIWLAVFMTWGWARFHQGAPKLGRPPKVKIPDSWPSQGIDGYN